eukprot:EG_transcript_170
MQRSPLRCPAGAAPTSPLPSPAPPRTDCPNARWRDRLLPRSTLSARLPAPDVREPRPSHSPESSHTPAHTLHGYVWAPRCLPPGLEYSSNYDPRVLPVFVRQLVACESAVLETCRAAAAKNKCSSAQLVHAGCTCTSIFGSAAGSMSDATFPGASPSSPLPSQRLMTHAAGQTQGYYPKPNPVKSGAPKAFLAALGDLRVPLSAVAAEVSLSYVQLHRKDPAATLLDLAAHQVPLHRATWLCKMLVLNTKPPAVKDVPHTAEVDVKLQAEWTLAWQRLLVGEVRRRFLPAAPAGAPCPAEAAYLVDLLAHQLDQGMVQPAGAIQSVLELLRGLPPAWPAAAEEDSLPTLLLRAVVQRYFVVFCSAGQHNLHSFVEFCADTLRQSHRQGQQRGEVWDALADALRCCLRHHEETVLSLAGVLRAALPGPLQEEEAKEDAAGSPPAKRRRLGPGVPERSAGEPQPPAPDDPDGDLLPGAEDGEAHRWLAAVLKRWSTPFAFSVRRLRFVAQLSRTVPRLAALHLTGGGAGALSPLVLATALDALLWNGDVCHAADLLFAGDVAEQQLEARFQLVCEWAMHRSGASPLAPRYAALLLARYPAPARRQALFEAALHRPPMADCARPPLPTPAADPIVAALTQQQRGGYQLLWHATQLGLFSLSRYYTAAVVGGGGALPLRHLPLDPRCHPTLAYCDLLAQRRTLLLQRGVLAEPLDGNSPSSPQPDLLDLPRELAHCQAEVGLGLGLPTPAASDGLAPAERLHPLLETVRTWSPALAVPTAAWLCTVLHEHLPALTAVQLRHAALVLLACGDVAAVADLCLALLRRAAADPTALRPDLLCTAVQLAGAYHRCFAGGGRMAALAEALFQLYASLLGADSKVAAQVRARLLEVVALNPAHFPGRTLTERWATQVEDRRATLGPPAVAKLQALLQDLGKLFPEASPATPGADPPRANVSDGFPPHFIFPSPSHPGATPAVALSPSPATGPSLLSRIATCEPKPGPGPPPTRKVSDWEQAIIQTVKVHFEDAARDGATAVGRIAETARRLQSGPAELTAPRIIFHLAQRFLCAILSYIHTGKGDLRSMQGYASILREVGAQVVYAGAAVAIIVQSHALPYLANPLVLLGPYYWRLLYAGVRKTEGDRAADALPAALPATAAAVGCFAVTAVAQQLLTVEALLGALSAALEEFAHCNLSDQPAMALDVLRGVLLLLPCVLHCPVKPSSAVLPQVWPLPRTHRAWTASLEEDYACYAEALAASLARHPPTTAALSHLLALLGRLWAQCSTVPALQPTAAVVEEVLEAALASGPLVQRLLAQHHYHPAGLTRDVFPASCMRDAAWQRLFGVFLQTAFRSTGIAVPAVPVFDLPGALALLQAVRWLPVWHSSLVGLALSHCCDALGLLGQLEPPRTLGTSPGPAPFPAAVVHILTESDEKLCDHASAFPSVVGALCCTVKSVQAVIPTLLLSLELTLSQCPDLPPKLAPSTGDPVAVPPPPGGGPPPDGPPPPSAADPGAWLGRLRTLLEALRSPAVCRSVAGTSGLELPLAVHVLVTAEAVVQRVEGLAGSEPGQGPLRPALAFAPLHEGVMAVVDWFLDFLVTAEGQRQAAAPPAFVAATQAALGLLSSDLCTNPPPSAVPLPHCRAGPSTAVAVLDCSPASRQTLECQLLRILQVLRTVAHASPAAAPAPPSLGPPPPPLPVPSAPPPGSPAPGLRPLWHDTLARFATPVPAGNAENHWRSAVRLPAAHVVRLCFALPSASLSQQLCIVPSTSSWRCAVHLPTLPGPQQLPESPSAISPSLLEVATPPSAPLSKHSIWVHQLPPFKAMEDTLMLPCDGCRVTHTVLPPALWGAQPLDSK